MFVVIDIEIHLDKYNYLYKTALFNELTSNNKVKINLYKTECL